MIERVDRTMTRKDFFLSTLSGAMLSLGFPKFGLFFVSWFALVPLLLALQGKKPREAFRLGFLCGIVHFATTLHWIQYVLQHYGAFPLPLALGCVLILAAYMALYPAAFSYVASRLEPWPLLWVIGLPGAWVTLEFIRAHALTGFPWANLGYTQTPWNLMIQVADITGVYGVSWLIVFTAVVIASFLLGHRSTRCALALCLCLAVALSYGSWRRSQVEARRQGVPPWPVAVVQGNIDQSVKWDPAFQQMTLQRYETLSLQAMASSPPPELLVWPETAVPFFYGFEEDLTAQLNKTFARIGKPVLFGVPSVTVVEERPKLQNAAYMVAPDGSRLGSYAKQHLVPFGEYVPYQRVLFFVNRLVEAAGDFEPGRGPSLMKLGGNSLGVLICYEGIFPELARAAVRRGANTLVNITNDAWYGDTGAPYQHMEMSLWRAVEFRVPLIRAANTGVSVIVDATGRIVGRIPLNETAQLVREVHPLEMETLYERWGDFFAWLCSLTTLVGVLYAHWKPRRIS